MDDRLDAMFHALSNKTRRELLTILLERPARVTELAQPYDMSVNAISKHLFVLERAGLIERRREGSVQLCVIKANPLREAEQWIGIYRGYWQEQLDKLSKVTADPKVVGPGDETMSDRDR